MKSVLTLGGVLVCSSLTVAALADPIPAPKLHAAAASAINVLEQSIRVWHQRRTCYSCHHQGLPVALAAEARARGVQVDEALARRNLSLGLQGLKNLDRAVQSAQQIDPATDTGSQLVAARVAGVPQGLARAVYAAIIAKKQRPDGSWETLDNRPPQSWSRVTATAMGVTAIRAYMPESRQQETEELVRRAGDWLLAARPRDTEDRAYQIFGAIEAGVDRVAVKPMAAALLTAQRPGWAQLASRASDAYATGEAAASDWRDEEAAPWMPVALFGNAAELERLLTAGLDPNSRTAAGTTILMMAAGDRDKVDTLVRHGADVNLAAKTGFTPLMIAANDPDATPAIRLLLERGAIVAPSNPKPLHDASALFFAVWSGNIDAVRLLLARGADVQAKMKVGGIFTAAPLELAALLGDLPMVRGLLDAGSDPNRLNDIGLPVISSAAMANRVAVAKALIASGADVNRVDELSLTPLMHAALVDYGDTEMVELLLGAGASLDPRSKDNHSALDLARQHGHAAIARLLERPRTGN